ncbi:MAG: hypothetical protein P1U63_13240 [Coxiellaceae bacterium]|nr:hypothetical protein [Coxiellaceae bacterium]
MKLQKDIEKQSYTSLDDSRCYDYCWPSEGICSIIPPILKSTTTQLLIPTIVGLITLNTGVGQLAKLSGSAFAVGAGIGSGVIRLLHIAQATNNCIDRQGGSQSMDLSSRKAWLAFLGAQTIPPLITGLITYYAGLPDIAQETAAAFGVGSAIGLAGSQVLNCMIDTHTRYKQQYS